MKPWTPRSTPKVLPPDNRTSTPIPTAPTEDEVAQTVATTVTAVYTAVWQEVEIWRAVETIAWTEGKW